MQVTKRMWRRFTSINRELYPKVRAVATSYPVYAFVTVAITGFAAWELVRRSAAAGIDEATLGWNAGWLLLLWMGIGLATGFIVHIAFWLLLTPYRARRPRRRSHEIDSQHTHKFDTRRSHEIAPHFFGVVGVIYAVLVAFVVVTAWQVRARA